MNGRERQLARALGWFSIGLGLAEVGLGVFDAWQKLDARITLGLLVVLGDVDDQTHVEPRCHSVHTASNGARSSGRGHGGRRRR